MILTTSILLQFVVIPTKQCCITFLDHNVYNNSKRMDTILHPCEAGKGDYCAALKQLLLQWLLIYFVVILSFMFL